MTETLWRPCQKLLYIISDIFDKDELLITDKISEIDTFVAYKPSEIRHFCEIELRYGNEG